MLGRTLLLVILLFPFISFSKSASLITLCKKNNPAACKEYGLMARSSKYLQKSCELNLPSGCTEWGLSLFKEKDSFLGEFAFQKGCKLNDGDSCGYLGAVIHKKGNIDNARLLYNKSCNLDSGKGCYNLGILNETSGDEREALDSYLKAVSYTHLTLPTIYSV